VLQWQIQDDRESEEKSKEDNERNQYRHKGAVRIQGQYELMEKWNNCLEEQNRERRHSGREGLIGTLQQGHHR